MRDKEKAAEMNRRWREENADAIRAKRRQQNKELRQWVYGLKEVPCADCGEEYPSYCMDFHHRDPGSKLGSVSQMINAGRTKRLIAEICKCDVVCAVCHRIKTHDEK